ncbi:MAG: peptide ABC transporter ATP-binding protein [Chloroflexi bacterium RBG_16_48_8]|nr:MAG: peptide ABC transporter ATP-binding protein [Chloroflexi bacterium RBG_16_48_8]
MDALLDIQDLKVCFHIPEGVVHAVNGISYKLNESETLAVVGESGCGKSVSMLSILGLIPLPPGEILDGKALYRGSNLLAMSEEQLEEIRGKEIAMVFQDPMTSLNPVLTIRRQVTEAFRTHIPMSQEQAETRAIELLDLVGIPDVPQRLREYPHQFSGGMRQRAMIAMALSCGPKLLIADEPTTALDVTIQAQIVELVMRMRDQMGMAVIWITHDLGVVAELADRVIVMYAGFMVEEADVHSLYQDPRHPYTIALLSALPRADRRRDRRLKSIPGAPPSLLVEPRGCPFARRCELVLERCWAENPPLDLCSPNHKIACWVDVKTGKPR